MQYKVHGIRYKQKRYTEIGVYLRLNISKINLFLRHPEFYRALIWPSFLVILQEPWMNEGKYVLQMGLYSQLYHRAKASANMGLVHLGRIPV